MTRIILIALNLFLGITALVGATYVVPAMSVELLAGTAFSDFTVPAVALGMLGVGALVAAALLVINLESGVLLSMAVGVGVAIFEIVEALIIGIEMWLQPFYFLVGVAISALAFGLYRRNPRWPFSSHTPPSMAPPRPSPSGSPTHFAPRA